MTKIYYFDADGYFQNILGAIQPRGGVGFGGQPANPGAFIPPQKERTTTIDTREDAVNMAGVLKFDSSRCSSIYEGATLQPSALQVLPCIRI